MRFSSRHRLLGGLIDSLGLRDQVMPFPMGDGNNRYYLRGRRFTRREAHESEHLLWRRLYRLRRGESGVHPSALIAGVIERNRIREQSAQARVS